MIEAVSLSHHYGDKEVLRDIDLRVPPGQLTALLGTNGAGKSTLLRCLAGDILPSSGRCEIFGKDSSEQDAEMASQRAVMSQLGNMGFSFRASEVVLLGRTPHFRRNPSERDRYLVEECMRKTHSWHLRDSLYPKLSGGEKQRVHLARALVQIWDAPPQKRAILLDEPTSALDLRHQLLALELVTELAESGASVLVILHDLNLAARYAHNVTILHRGQILVSASPKEAITPENIATAFSMDAHVLTHPDSSTPLVVPKAAISPATQNRNLSA